MSPLVETAIFVFSLVGAGYLAGLTGYLRVEQGDALADFAVGVALPLLLFRTMIGVDFHGVAPWSLWAAYFATVAVAWTCGHLVMTRIFGQGGRFGVVGGVTGAFSNMVLLGMPFILGVYGTAGFEVISLLITVHLPVMIAASILLFEWFAPAEERAGGGLPAMAKAFAGRMLTNPLIIGILSGLAARALGLTPPTAALRLIDSLANVAGPVALFAMGLSLRKFGVSGNIKPSLALVAVKLVLMPAVALGMALLFQLPPLTAKVAVATAALPAGVNSYLIAARFGLGQGLASNAMTIGTAFAVVSAALWLAIAERVFG